MLFYYFILKEGFFLLSDKSNQRVRDGVLFKKLKLILKNSSKESDSLWNDILIILKDCKTSSIKEQVIVTIIQKYINILHVSIFQDD